MTAVNENGIPDELKRHKQWVTWRYEQVEPPPKKPTKVPYSAITGRMASSVDRLSWSTFQDAIRFQRAHNYDGVGFVLTRDDPYTVIDLDAPTTEDDRIKNNDIFFKMNSFTEYSPSGTGVHIWTKAEVSKGRNKRPVEVYSNMRFMTVTGNVCHDVPIEYRQEEVFDLWQSIAPKTSDIYVTYDGTDPVPCDDQGVIDKAASAKNGHKFIQLWHGNYGEWYQSQSEADFALIDILAFYTQNTEQIARLFRFSALGQRAKAWRDDYLLPTINKAYDKLPPKINLESMQQQTAAMLAAHLAAQQATAPLATTPEAVPQQITEQSIDMNAQSFIATNYAASSVDDPYTMPEGLMGEIAEYVYRSAPRPVKELAIGAAIGLMAGIAGNSFNVSGLGLNTYLLLLAPTGVGKEAVHTGISKLMNTIKPLVPSSDLFMGPSEIASPQALLNRLASKQRCFVSVIGECGMWLKNVSDSNAPAHFQGLRRVLLALYGKSGMGSTVQPTIYADSAKNTETIISPSVSLLGESTPLRFFENIDEELISEGFIPRWTIIQYDGPRPKNNPDHNTVYPNSELISGLAALAMFCNQQMSSLQAVNVAYSPEAQKLIDEFDTFCDAQINGTAEEAIRDLWTRAHVKTLKLAALVAVGKNLSMPTISESDFLWARHVVLKDVMRMCRRFNMGLLTTRVAQNDNEQQTRLIGTIKSYILDKPATAKYGVKPEMMPVNAIPYIYFQRRLANTKAFKNDRRGATAALHSAIKALIMSGLLVEMPDTQSRAQFNTSGKIYVPTDIDLLLSNG